MELHDGDVVIRKVHVYRPTYNILEEIANHFDIKDPLLVIPKCVMAISKMISNTKEDF